MYSMLNESLKQDLIKKYVEPGLITNEELEKLSERQAGILNGPLFDTLVEKAKTTEEKKKLISRLLQIEWVQLDRLYRLSEEFAENKISCEGLKECIENKLITGADILSAGMGISYPLLAHLNLAEVREDLRERKITFNELYETSREWYVKGDTGVSIKEAQELTKLQREQLARSEVLQTFGTIRVFIRFSEFAEKFKEPLPDYILTALNTQSARKYLIGLLNGTMDTVDTGEAPAEKLKEFLSLGEEFFTELAFRNDERLVEELEARWLQGYLAGSNFQGASSLTIERLRGLKLHQLENLRSFITSANKKVPLGRYLNENLTSIEEILQFPEIDFSTYTYLKKLEAIEIVKKDPSLLVSIININWYRLKGHTVSNLNREQQLSLQLTPVREAVEKGEITFEQAKNIGGNLKYRNILRKRIITPKDFLALEEQQRSQLFSLPTGAIECIPGIISLEQALRLQPHQAVNLALLKVGSMGGYYNIEIVSPNIIEECFREGIITAEQILQVGNAIETRKLELLAIFINHPGIKEGMRARLWNLAQVIQVIHLLIKSELNILVECLRRGRQSPAEFNDIIKEILSFSSAPLPLSLLPEEAIEAVNRGLLTLPQILTMVKALQIQPSYALRKITFDRILDNMLSSSPLTYAQVERLLPVEAGVVEMILNNIAGNPQLIVEITQGTLSLEELIDNNTVEYHERLAIEQQRQLEQEDRRAQQQRRHQENRDYYQQFTPAPVQQREVAYRPARTGSHLLTADLFQDYMTCGNSHYHLNTQKAKEKGLLTELSEENLCQDFKDIFTKSSYVLGKDTIVRNFKITSNGTESIADDRNYIIKPSYTGREHRAMGQEKIWGKIGSLLFCFAPGREGAMDFKCFFIEKTAGNSIKLWPLAYNLNLARGEALMKFEDYFPLMSNMYESDMTFVENNLLQRPDQQHLAKKIYGIRALFGQAMQCKLDKQAFFKKFAELYCNTDKFKDFYNYLSDVTDGKATAILDECPDIKIKIMNDIEKYANGQGLSNRQILQKIAHHAGAKGREGNFIANIASTYDDQAIECVFLLLKIIRSAKGAQLTAEDIDAFNVGTCLDLPNGVEFKWFLGKVNENKPWSEVQRELEAAKAKEEGQAGPSGSSTDHSDGLTTQLEGITLEGEPDAKKKKETDGRLL